MMKTLLSILLLYIAALAGPATGYGHEPTGKPDFKRPPRWVDSLMNTMTLRQKVGQTMFVFSYSRTDPRDFRKLRGYIEEQAIGGVLLSRGTIADAILLTDSLQKWSSVPILTCADFENGLAMRLDGATEFPSAMALGATRDPNLARQMAEAIAREMRAVGVYQNFAPVADVNNNPANPVINTRSFGEDPALVADMASAYVAGLQSGNVVATIKHFPGHGDTEYDSHFYLPIIAKSERELELTEFVPFRRAMKAGALAVMSAHIAVPSLTGDSTLPVTLSRSGLDSLLRRGFGFDGVIVTDALNMKAITDHYGAVDAAVAALNAGANMILMPKRVGEVVDSIVARAERGEIDMQRIDHSAKRILLLKHWLGLHQSRKKSAPGILSDGKHAKLAERIAEKAVTLVKNDGGLLPMESGKSISLISLLHRSDSTEASFFRALLQERYPNVTAMHIERKFDIEDVDSIAALAASSDVVIVAAYIGVSPGSRYHGLSFAHRALLDSLMKLDVLKAMISFNNPYIVAAMPDADAMLCTYDDGLPSLAAAAKALSGELEPTGALPVTIPGVAPYGRGYRYLKSVDMQIASLEKTMVERSLESTPTNRVDSGVASSHAAPSNRPSRPEPPAPIKQHYDFSNVESLIEQKILERAFPGAQLVIVENGKPIYSKEFGTTTYGDGAPAVTHATLYDLASLTKVLATTPSIMKLYDEGKLSLDDRVAKYIPEFAANGKGAVTIRHLLTHTSGLPAHKPFWQMAETREAALDSVFASELLTAPGERMKYSDLGFITLGEIVERISGARLDRYADSVLYTPLGMSETQFTPPASLKPRIAPTEIDKNWRGGLVHGEVHDENAARLNGVAGHAGLFANAYDLVPYVIMMLNGGSYNGRQFFKPETVEMFTDRQPNAGSRALGWDTRSATGSSSGQYFSMDAFGHTGFTGTSIWFDPPARLTVIFLTNRVHPTRENKALPRFRSTLHDAIREAMAQ
ncbi:MAG: beta-N-acetylglucosaminidase [Ectothiorhodospiraceae bacterium]|nr:beta-N-acetylglucosaminidase [Ectothiorhodospiraceae bacterium]